MKGTEMPDLSLVKTDMNVVTSDGVHLGTVDRIEGSRVFLSAADYPPGTGGDSDRHEYVDVGLVDTIEGDTVRLSVTASAAEVAEVRKPDWS
jgi:hypothetical protein